ncbi:MAG: LysR family transcriptional regulator [Pseudomonadales bacterium]
MSVSPRRPSMTWARAFCEAARHKSFKAAAQALHVSPSTISHEVRKLEDWLGTPLFDRSGRRIALTAEGERLYQSVAVGFDHLDRAFDRHRGVAQGALRLGILPFVASEFVLPRMRALQQLLDNEAVELLSSTHLADLGEVDPQQRVDAIVRYSEKPPVGYTAIELTQISIGVVTAADCADQATRLPRVRGNNLFDAWQVLDAAAAAPAETSVAPLVVDNYLSGLRAVEHGLGIGAVILPLSTDWLQEGRIRLWSRQLVDIPERYWLVYAASSPRARELQRIGQWLRAELASANQTLATLQASR